MQFCLLAWWRQKEKKTHPTPTYSVRVFSTGAPEEVTLVKLVSVGSAEITMLGDWIVWALCWSLYLQSDLDFMHIWYAELISTCVNLTFNYWINLYLYGTLLPQVFYIVGDSIMRELSAVLMDKDLHFTVEYKEILDLPYMMWGGGSIITVSCFLMGIDTGCFFIIWVVTQRRKAFSSLGSRCLHGLLFGHLFMDLH